MDWASFTFGAIMACVTVFGATALALHAIIGRGFLAWMWARALAIGLLALTFPPASAFLFADPLDAWAARLAATDIGIAVCGPLLVTYLEPRIRVRGLSTMLWAVLPAGLAMAVAAPLVARSAQLWLIHDALVGCLLAVIVIGLVCAIRAGSRTARFQAVAWAPGLMVGTFTLSYELIRHQGLLFYVEAMLAALLFEIIVTATGIGDATVIIRRERDLAIGDVRRAIRASAIDPLTGVDNRRGLAERFANPSAERPIGLAVIDCDHFKRINDNFGHGVGDEVLVAVAEALRGEGVFVGRLGGEEFVLLITREDWRQRAEAARRRVSAAVAARVPQLPFRVTASAGLAPVRAQDSLESAIRRADRALYAAKDAGRDRALMLTEGTGPAERRLAGVA
ncbi:sensor domain-containing diguanylate cyclase [Qipengyuania sediminis]|uniref:GGDEF domain-containing protein n=1 Tax=Qipengyuania sediminis TaxID=1532023 RepID=UPI00105A5A53|nr:GGDEF domain-containing protein [Qipengyuania sediminis]